MGSKVECRLLPAPPDEPKPGDMFLCPWLLNERGEPYENDQHLSDQYRRETIRSRAPLTVVLPGGGQWVVDNISSQDRKAGNRSGWSVSGTPPRITARPSILVNQGTASEYHGYLTDGVLESC